MKVVTLEVDKREKLGSAESRRLRRAGRIPVNLYGMGREPANFTVDSHGFTQQFENGNRMFELKLGDAVQICMLKDLQYDAMGDDILHADLLRVDDTVPVTANVAIEFSGVPDSPAGATMDYIRHDISVTAIPRSIPEKIEVNVSAIPVGTRMTAKELPLPEGVELAERAEATIVTHHYKHGGNTDDAAGEGEDGDGEGEDS